MKDLIGPEQSAFVPRRSIIENVMLANELVQGYDNRNGRATCFLKMDIAQAYDTLEWDFIEACLSNYGFREVLIKRIMLCIMTCRFSMALNGKLVDVFSALRGIWQGDPLSPYIFV